MAVCGGCFPWVNCGFTQIWDGVLTYNGTTSWLNVLSCTYGSHKLQATIVFTPNLFTLTVVCDTGDISWQGTKALGDNPVGTYVRTSGCDTTTRMYVT